MDTWKKLRLLLESRAESVLNAREENFAAEINMFLSFIRSEDILAAIIREIEIMSFDFETYYKQHGKKHNRFIEFPSNYSEKISLCYSLLHAFSTGKLSCYDERFLYTSPSSRPDDICKAVADQYFKPIYGFLLEGLYEHSNVLYLLGRYKHRTEWFHKERIASLFELDSKRGEYNLTLNLREYLHDQGIDYPFSTPHSPSGRADLAGFLDTKDPLVLEVKIFCPKRHYGRSYIRKGLYQTHQYALDYDKPIGYLVVYNFDNRLLVFQRKAEEIGKTVKVGDKIIQIIVINVGGNEKSASKLKVRREYLIDDEYLSGADHE